MIIRKSESCPGSPARRPPTSTDQESDSDPEDGDSGALDLSLPLRKRAFDEPAELRQHSNPKKKIIRRYYRKSATTARSHIDRFFFFPLPSYDNTACCRSSCLFVSLSLSVRSSLPIRLVPSFTNSRT